MSDSRDRAEKLTAARPMCAVCGKRVDKMTSEEDPITDRVIFTVWCHGKRETTRLDREVLEGVVGIDVGEAFRPRGTLLDEVGHE